MYRSGYLCPNKVKSDTIEVFSSLFVSSMTPGSACVFTILYFGILFVLHVVLSVVVPFGIVILREMGYGEESLYFIYTHCHV